MSEKSQKLSAEYRQRVIDAIVEKGMAAWAHVCQMCGEIRTIKGVISAWGSFVDVEGKKEFTCRDCGAKMDMQERKQVVKANSKRYCEICSQPFKPTKKNSFRVVWVCNSCLKKIDKPLEKVNKFLRELSLRRYLESSKMSNDELRNLHISLALQHFERGTGKLSPIERLRFEATREQRLQTFLKQLSAFHGIEQSEIAPERPSPHHRLQNAIAKDGAIWTITFRGNSVRLPNLDGLTYIVYLLQHPNESISATQLADMIAKKKTGQSTSKVYKEISKCEIEEEGLHQTSDLGDAGEAADKKTLDQLKRHLAEIKQEKEEAKQFQNWETYAKLEDDEEKIEQYLSANYGLKGKPRPAGSHADRMRINVRRAIKRVLNKISEQDKALATYLRSTIKTGYQVSYAPDPNNPVSWNF